METEKMKKIWKVVKTIIELILAAIGGMVAENQLDVVATFISNI